MLVLLILVEILVLNISLILFLVFRFKFIEVYIIYYLVFRVCESVLGLRLLVIIVRYYGSELFYIFNISKF